VVEEQEGEGEELAEEVERENEARPARRLILLAFPLEVEHNGCINCLDDVEDHSEDVGHSETD